MRWRRLGSESSDTYPKMPNPLRAAPQSFGCSTLGSESWVAMGRARMSTPHCNCSRINGSAGPFSMTLALRLLLQWSVDVAMACW